MMPESQRHLLLIQTFATRLEWEAWLAAHHASSPPFRPWVGRAGWPAGRVGRQPKAKAFFGTLNSQNRYAVLCRIQTAKKAETRARRVAQFVAMLERHEVIHP